MQREVDSSQGRQYAALMQSTNNTAKGILFHVRYVCACNNKMANRFVINSLLY